MEKRAMLRRPQKGDDEEELFRMQEKFNQSVLVPCAKVINLRPSSEDSRKDTLPASNDSKRDPGTNLSELSQSKKSKTDQKRISAPRACGETINPSSRQYANTSSTGEKLRDSVQNMPATTTSTILGNIVERKYPSREYECASGGRLSRGRADVGFPEAFVANCKTVDSDKSLFQKHVSKIAANTAENNEILETLHGHPGNISIVEPMATGIHESNMETLNRMSRGEILKEKSGLESTLSPDLIEFLKSRKSVKRSTKKGNLESVGQKNNLTETRGSIFARNTKMDVSTSFTDTTQPPVEMMKRAKDEGWLHMDSFESEKLEWMTDVSVEKKDVLPPDQPYNARFDFNGVLLPFKDESLLVDKGLHHHGDEPERPGYSLQELLQLSRSSVRHQRCMALTTLANIFTKSREGLYDEALQPAPLVALHEKNILLLLRFSVDETSIAVATAALQALRAFLFSESDEMCLDKYFGLTGYIEPTLSVPPNDAGNTSDIKDHELAQIDVVAAAIRSDIVLRLRYILSELRPPPIGVNAIFDILIRLARHSTATALNIVCTPYLLETIVQNFMPLSMDLLAGQDIITDFYGVPVVNAVRLCRILIAYAGRPAAERLYNLGIIETILTYITADVGRESLHLHIESLRLWELVIMHNVARDSIEGMRLILMPQLQLLLSNHDIGRASESSCEYAAALIATTVHIPSLKSTTALLLEKWSTQLSSVTNLTVSQVEYFTQMRKKQNRRP